MPLKTKKDDQRNEFDPHWVPNIYRFVLFYLPTPPLGQDMTQGQFLSGV